MSADNRLRVEQHYLVTGGAGFIGSEVTRQLAAAGAEVTIVDNLVNGKRGNVEDVLNDHVRLVVADVRDGAQMACLLRGVDVVLHLACLGVRHSIHSPFENHEVNATATLRLLQAARRLGVKEFVYVSSSEVYGTARRVPMDEDHPTFPRTVYGAGKLAGECYTRAFFETYRYPTVVLRPFNAYGPRCHHEGDCGEVIPRFMLRCMAGRPMIIFGDGCQTRDFTYVSDTARGIILAALADEAVGRTMNLGSSTEIAVKELARVIGKVVGEGDPQIVHDVPRPGDVMRLYADAGRARRILGFEPSVGLQEGLTKLHEWYVAQSRPAAALLEEEIVHNWDLSGAGVA